MRVSMVAAVALASVGVLGAAQALNGPVGMQVCLGGQSADDSMGK